MSDPLSGMTHVSIKSIMLCFIKIQQSHWET